MKRIVGALILVLLSGCQNYAERREAQERVNAELAKATAPRPVPEAVANALIPPISIQLPKASVLPEERFNVTFTNLPASQFFTAVATGTRYNMLVHPQVSGNITVNLKNVTLFEALDAVRELYGYDYKIEGSTIYIRPLAMQTRIFRVNYLTGVRRGISDIRVSSGAAGDTSAGGGTTSTTSATGGTTTSTASPKTLETSKINTTSVADFWADLKSALEAIVGIERFAVGGTVAPGTVAPANVAAAAAAAQATAAGTRPPTGTIPTALPCRGDRCVIVNPQSGIVVVRAMPEELRSVEAFLKATQLSVDRQVILEAKIIEVQLNSGFQSGINWATFARYSGSSANQLAAGFLAPGTSLQPLAPGTQYPQAIATAGVNAIAATPGLNISTPAENTGSIFGFAFQATNFAALISFLESQGTVNVLSSPRISTLNNQKAVLKIGVDELFVTNVTSSSTVSTGATSTIQPPTVTLQSYFSGIVLDVTPQIDERNNITLHIRPSVSQVTSVNKLIDVGASRPFSLPVPSANTSETDSIVRGRDGQVIVIGGLMRYAANTDRNQLPIAGDLPGIGNLFRNRNDISQKRELVILLKPIIVPEDSSWSEDIVETQRRIQALEPRERVLLPQER